MPLVSKQTSFDIAMSKVSIMDYFLKVAVNQIRISNWLNPGQDTSIRGKDVWIPAFAGRARGWWGDGHRGGSC